MGHREQAAPLEAGAFGLLVRHSNAVAPRNRALRAAFEQAGVVDVNQSCAENEELAFHSRVAADDGLRRKFDRIFLEFLQKRGFIELFAL